MGAALAILNETEVLEPKFKDGDDGGEALPPDKITVHNTVNGWSIKLSFTQEDGTILEERFSFVAGAEPAEQAGFNAAIKLIAAAMGTDPAKVNITSDEAVVE
jgi:hypothetical protein